jgi:hypothetical protein
VSKPQFHSIKGERDQRFNSSPLGIAVDSVREKRPTFSTRGRVLPNNTRAGRINLMAVADVLAEHGLDPAVELVKIVKTNKLPPDVTARVLNELLQYTQPKLKSVEVRGKVAVTAFDINDDQARAIAQEFLKASAGDGAPRLTVDEAMEAMLK